MTKQAWVAHMTAAGFPVRGTRSEVLPAREHMTACRICAARRRTRRANKNSRERADAMRSLGMVKTPFGWE